MSKDLFVGLVAGLCNACGIAGIAAVADGGAIEVDGVRFSLVHSDEIHSQRLLIYCDIGQASDDAKAGSYARLLLKNFFATAYRGPVFTLAPDTGRILMVQVEDLQALNPERLIERLDSLARYARTWHEPPGDMRAAADAQPPVRGMGQAGPLRQPLEAASA